MGRWSATFVAAAAILASCAGAGTVGPGAPRRAPEATAATVRPAVSAGPADATVGSVGSATCQIRGALPDPVCMPGAIDPSVTRANIGQTICVSGYTATVRPPTSYTTPLKVTQMRAYGFGGAATNYEEDHIIPLELGGSPRDPRNLWPQPRGGNPNASVKDALDNSLHALVCSGRVPLAVAQEAIAWDWVATSNAALGSSTLPTPARASLTPAVQP